MSWVKLDDQFFSHPKAREAGKDGCLLFLAGLTYCARHLTDGKIPKSSLPVIAAESFVKPSVALRLVSAGLWQDEGDCYRAHDYLEFNPSRERVLSDRQRRSEAGAKGADARWHGASNGTSHTDRIEAAHVPHADRIDNADAPVPSPTPELLTICAPEARAIPFEDDFTEWYSGYPRKQAKPDAFKAYKAKRRQGRTADELITARDNMIAAIDRDGTALDFVPYPASFLNSRLEDFHELQPSGARQKPQDLNGPRPCARCGEGKFLPGSGWVEKCACRREFA